MLLPVCYYLCVTSCQVIIKLSDQVTACMSDPRLSTWTGGGGPDSQTFKQLQQQIENLKVKLTVSKLAC